MVSGYFSGFGLDDLAKAGEAGHWPRLRVLKFNEFEATEFEDEGEWLDPDEFTGRLEKAWPDLKISIEEPLPCPPSPYWDLSD